jgi:hypothetical protein
MSSKNSHNPEADRWVNVDPMFDGHLEKPLQQMTVQERLDWIDAMMKFRHWVRTELRDLGPQNHPSSPAA